MKRILIKIIKFLNTDLSWWVCCILGVLLMLVPPLHAASKGITSLEPGFSYGVFYGIGCVLSIDGIFSSFYQKKKVAADQERSI